MYTVSNRPSSIVAKTRRNILQNVERLETKKPQATEEGSNVPKPVFQPVNGKKNHISKSQNHISPQQEEVVKFIYDSWTSVCKKSEEEMEIKKAQRSNRVVYYECQPNNELKDFTPFDLESWWGKRFLNTLTSIP